MNTVLVIDPDNSVRQTVEEVCADWGVHCIGTPHLSEGREIRETQNIGLMIVDLFVPEKSGFSFIAEVTSHEPCSHVIAIFSPLKAPQINIYRFTRMLGVSYTLEKPLDHRILQVVFQDLWPYVRAPRQPISFYHQYQ